MRRTRSEETVHPLVPTEAAIEVMLVRGLVQQYLVEKHLPLMHSLSREAKAYLSKFDESQLRCLAAEKVGRPEKSITELGEELEVLAKEQKR